MSETADSRNVPFAVEVEAGETYYWCSCGKSKSRPFCDGAHQGGSFQPVPFTADNTETVYLCGCGKTGNTPLCDGSHQ